MKPEVLEIITAEDYDPSAGWCVQRAIHEAFGIVVDDDRDNIPKVEIPTLAKEYNLIHYGPGPVLLRANESVVAILIQNDQETDHAVSGQWKDLAKKELAAVLTTNPVKFP